MQIIRFSWNKFQPSMTFDTGNSEKILGRQLKMTIGEKKCIGYRKKSKRIPCPLDATTANGYYCNHCRIADDFFLCVKCSGDCINRKRRDKCKEENYFVYLAAFDRLIKVGITQQYRFLERLVEQGADFAAKICRVIDGKEVRLLEKKISEEFSITDRVPGKEKNTLLFSDPNEAISSMFSAIRNLQGNGFSKHMISPEIFDLRRYYKMENVLDKPKYTDPFKGMEIEGNVVAAKGNLIILQTDKRFLSFNSHRLIGRHVENFCIN